MVRTGVANLPNGRAEAKEAMNDVTEEIVTGMEARISYLAIIGTLGPMIGLVGTIWGMIMSFQVIATAAGRPAQAREDRRGDLHGAVHHARRASRWRSRRSSSTPSSATGSPRSAMETTKVADRTINSLVAAAKQAKSGLTRDATIDTTPTGGPSPCRHP